MFIGQMMLTINIEHCFDSEGWNIKDGIQKAPQARKTYLTNILDKNILILTFMDL